MAGLRGVMRREQIRAAAVLAAPLLLALVVWVGVVAGAGGDEGVSDALGSASEPAADPEGATGPVEASETEPSPADETDGAADPTADDAAAGPGEPVTIVFDDVCEVEVDPGERDEDLRPWQFPDCERAPIALAPSQQRWIVVVASLWGEDFSERDALERVEAGGGSTQLLWSSHYPSLNPGLWVVVEGPFGDETAAERAADRIGGGAYARELSDDEGDRYCIAADGCVGETRQAGVTRTAPGTPAPRED